MARALALVGALCACASEEERCPGGGERDLVVVPTLFSYPPLENGALVPIYVPSQGGVWTELDLELTGVAEDELSVLAITAVIQGGGGTGSFPASMTYPVECRADASLLLEQVGVSFAGFFDPAEIDGRTATLVTQLQLTGGQAPLTREYEIVLEARTLN